MQQDSLLYHFINSTRFLTDSWYATSKLYGINSREYTKQTQFKQIEAHAGKKKIQREQRECMKSKSEN